MSCLCPEHHRQERALYFYYKEHEACYEFAKQGAETGEQLARAHKHLTITICARLLHTEWFFDNDADPGHEHWYKGLVYDRLCLHGSIFDLDLAFINDNVEEEIISRLKEEVPKAGPDWPKQENRSELFGPMPSIKITEVGTPGSHCRQKPKEPEFEWWEGHATVAVWDCDAAIEHDPYWHDEPDKDRPDYDHSLIKVAEEKM
ncbi:hypothetical protein SLS62_011180 [Diatrype stigma]|uniref:Uncharacterized protein n=1 Tax=Diatrype stigma TaxID=117547 RepID=A0AAN9U593_9PEZI